jgi:hypothetical protein
MRPTLTLLGVYRLEVTPEIFAAQLPMFGDEDQCLGRGAPVERWRGPGRRRINCVRGSGRLRFAFFMHYWNPELPLRWTYGEVVCPVPQPMPARLEILMPYRPCD